MTRSKNQKGKGNSQKAQPEKAQPVKHQKNSSSVPLASGSRVTNQIARMGQSARGCTVSHRELVYQFDWDATGDTLWSWTVNPSDDAVFPWLSKVAKNYEMYKFSSLRFIFNSRLAATTPGLALLAFEPDPDDVSPDNSLGARQMLAAMPHSVETNVWSSCTYTVPAQVLHQRQGQVGLFIEDDDDGTAEKRSRDLGCFYILLAGLGSTALVAGDLWVEYSVELITPQLQAATTTHGLASPSLNVIPADTIVASDQGRVRNVDRMLETIVAPTGGYTQITNGDNIFSVASQLGRVVLTCAKDFTGPVELSLDKKGLRAGNAGIPIGVLPTGYSLRRYLLSDGGDEFFKDQIALSTVWDSNSVSAGNVLLQLFRLVAQTTLSWNKGQRYVFKLFKDGALSAQNVESAFSSFNLILGTLGLYSRVNSLAKRVFTVAKGDAVGTSFVRLISINPAIPSDCKPF